MPNTFTSSTRCHSASSLSSTVPAAPIPALFTTMSRRPRAPGLGDGGTNHGVVGHVGRDRVEVGSFPVRLDPFFPVQHGHASAAGGQQSGRGQADPGGAPGDQRRQPGEFSRLLHHRIAALKSGAQASELAASPPRNVGVMVASVFACTGTVCFPPLLRKQCSGSTARMPGSCGTWPSNSFGTGAQAARTPPATLSSVGSSPPPAPSIRGLAAGSQTVQQQLPRFRSGNGRIPQLGQSGPKPSWRKAGRNEGFLS